MQQQTLPLEYWGFERWPFPGTLAADQFYPTAGNHEALARIEYLVTGRRRIGALLGESGVGKSLLLQSAARRVTRQGAVAVSLSALGVTPRELLWQFAAQLGAAPREEADAAQLWRQAVDRVAENRLQQASTVLLVDDAGYAGPDVAALLVRLSRLDPSPTARWTMVLATEPSPVARWSSTLRDLVDLRIHLGAWELEDTVGYVQTALVDAGRLEPVFEESALLRLHELAQGIPRAVARLADYALLAAAASESTTIDAAAVEAADDETAWPVPAMAY